MGFNHKTFCNIHSRVPTNQLRMKDILNSAIWLYIQAGVHYLSEINSGDRYSFVPTKLESRFYSLSLKVSSVSISFPSSSARLAYLKCSFISLNFASFSVGILDSS